jgi:nucleotide-binding universal stress UspA family protein
MTTDPRRIVVGYDGSDHAAAAVDWAAAEAQRRGAPLTVLHVAEYGVAQGPVGPTPWRPDIVEAAATSIVAAGVERARKTATDVAVEGTWTTSGAALQLVRASQQAALLVVGTRGHSELVGAAIGSVAFSVSSHAHCPVVVVRGADPRTAGPGRPVVVGVDGSDCAREAVRFAAVTAAELHAPLTVVSAWPSYEGQAQGSMAAWVVDGEAIRAFDTEMRSYAEELAATAAREAATAAPGVEVTRTVAEGRAADVLATAGREAGLVVVGSRGRGAFAGLVLGSTSHRLIHLSPCSVAVVRCSPGTSAGRTGGEDS